MRVLVTGAAGFIGSHLVDQLVRNGNEAVTFDNFGRSVPAALRSPSPGITVVPGDIRDYKSVCEVTHGCTVVFILRPSHDC